MGTATSGSRQPAARSLLTKSRRQLLDPATSNEVHQMPSIADNLKLSTPILRPPCAKQTPSLGHTEKHTPWLKGKLSFPQPPLKPD